MNKLLVFLVIGLIGVGANPTLFVTYGDRPQNELIIRYMDKEKEGFIESNNQVMATDNIPLKGKYILHRKVSV